MWYKLRKNLPTKKKGYQPPIISRTGSSQVPQGFSMTAPPLPPTHQGGPGGQQGQGHQVVLHDQEEGYQLPITSRTGSSQVPQGLSMSPLPVKVDQVKCEFKNMGYFFII